MLKKGHSSLLMFSVFYMLSAQAEIGTKVVQNQIFDNQDCMGTDECALESFSVKTVSEVGLGKAFTHMSAGFSVKENSDLKKFAIVQFHQGCMYNQTSAGVKFLHRSYMGVSGVPFVHKKMMVDSANDSDPIYQSSPRGGQDDGFGYIYPRKEYYYIFEPNFEGINEHQDSYMNNLSNPDVTALYVSDSPSPAILDKKQISSLNFKTCIFNMDEVPLHLIDPTDIKAESAIMCFSWKHNWKIDSNNKLVRRDGIDPACFEGENK